MSPAVRRVVGAATVLAALVGAPLMVSSAEGAPVGTLSVSRTAGMPGEALTVKVAGLPGPAARPARLDRCVAYTDGTWTTCTYWVEVMTLTTTDHAATFNTRVHAMQNNQYRVYAPATSSSAAAYSPIKEVEGVQQEAAISLPATAAAGSTVTVSLALTPARTGRQLALEKRNADGTWTQVGAAVASSSSGTATVSLALPAAGAFTYRAVAMTWAPSGTNTRVGWFPSFPARVVVS